MNNLTIIGRITKDAETRTVSVGGVQTLVTDFTVAANEGYGDNQTTEYFRVTLWRDRGAKLAPSLKKGRIIAAKGQVSGRGWTDQEGKARYSLEVKNPSVQLLDKKPGDPEDAPEAEEEKPF